MNSGTISSSIRANLVKNPDEAYLSRTAPGGVQEHDTGSSI